MTTVIWIDWYSYHISRFRALFEYPAFGRQVTGIELVGGCGVHSGDALRNQFRRTKLTIVDQVACRVARKFYTNFFKTSWSLCHYSIFRHFAICRFVKEHQLPDPNGLPFRARFNTLQLFYNDSR